MSRCRGRGVANDGCADVGGVGWLVLVQGRGAQFLVNAGQRAAVSLQLGVWHCDWG